MTATAPVEPAAPSASLRPRPDQIERWIAHARPVRFAVAAVVAVAKDFIFGEREEAKD